MKNLLRHITKRSGSKLSTIISLILLLPLISIAQGIKFEEGLTWAQVKQKAKQENKYIFVDVYTTWCAPCKIMDRDIYPLKQVGDLYNQKFISFKIEFDKVPKDSTDAGNKDVWEINSKFTIGAYPTYLFLNPKGELVHRVSGGLNADSFLATANIALQEKGYSSLIKKFREGKYEDLNLKQLATSAKYAKEDSLSLEIATVYIQTTEIKELIKQENMAFVFIFGERNKNWAKSVCMPKLQGLSVYQLANIPAIRFLLHAARNDSLARMATDYWFTTLSSEALFSKDTLEYLASFVRHSTDKAFSFLRNNSKKIDKVMGEQNWSQDRLDDIVLSEEFSADYSKAANLLKNGTNGETIATPDWERLNATITAKHGASCAERLQFKPKIYWYNLVGNKAQYTKNLVAEMNQTKGWKLNILVLNNKAMDIFEFSRNKKEILRTIYWMKKYFKEKPEELNKDAIAIDTYAILLYKAGKVKKGIMLEEKAFKIKPNNKEVVNNLSKMKQGLPIWPQGFDVIK